MSLFNPLDHVFETKRFVYSRTYRTTFLGKCKDTFETFSGVQVYPLQRSHFGVFDYLTLGSCFILNYLTILVMRRAPGIVGVLAVSGVYVILQLPRLIFSIVMTGVSLPFVAMVHKRVSKDGEAIKKDILSYKVRDEQTKLFLLPSYLPENLMGYKNAYIFIEDHNSLYYVDCEGRLNSLTMKNVEAFREQQFVSRTQIRLMPVQYQLVKKQDMQAYIVDDISDSHLLTFKQLLESQGEVIEEGLLSSVELSDSSVQITLEERRVSSERPARLCGVGLSLEDGQDISFFKDMRRLNVAGVEKAIEALESSQLVKI